jgi:type IX secretion system PorP/SprF family membrane protein
MKTKFILLFLFFVCLRLQAQDPRFVQFYAAPLQLNPAMTGVHPGKWRASANYREQWSSILDTRPFRTISSSFDSKSRIGRGDFFAYGITLLNDQAGKSEYTRNTADLSLSYMKQLDGSRYRRYDQYLVGGLQAGLGQHSLNQNNLWFSSQFNLGNEQVDRSISSGESISDQSNTYWNLNAGLVWYAVFDHNQSLYLGGAFHHLNAPEVSFIADGQETLDRKWVVHAGGELPFNRQLSILPAIAVVGQGPSMLAMAGANLRYTNRDWKEVAIRAGAWGQLVNDVSGKLANPAITFTTILEIERLNIGISYDIGVNKLAAPTNGRGALELSVIYYQPATRREKVNCPKL